MKYGYIQYGNMSQELWKLSPEQRNKKMEEYKAVAEKQARARAENIVVVYETPKPLSAMFEDKLPSIMTNGRTDIVAIPEKKDGVAAQP